MKKDSSLHLKKVLQDILFPNPEQCELMNICFIRGISLMLSDNWLNTANSKKRFFCSFINTPSSKENSNPLEKTSRMLFCTKCRKY